MVQCVVSVGLHEHKQKYYAPSAPGNKLISSPGLSTDPQTIPDKTILLRGLSNLGLTASAYSSLTIG
jgi:hypothetical protein